MAGAAAIQRSREGDSLPQNPAAEEFKHSEQICEETAPATLSPPGGRCLHEPEVFPCLCIAMAGSGL